MAERKTRRTRNSGKNMRRSATLGDALVHWYRQCQRRLPWRQTNDPYRIWVSEIMLQQTRVDVVIPYYERFLARFPTVADLAASDEDDVLSLWSGLGYYRRARSLLAGARYVAEMHAGEFPTRWEDALSIPGVGPYTAAAILSIAFGHRAPVVDGNVERVVTRLLRLRGNPRTAALRRRISEFALEAMAESTPGDFNQAVMELGATICTPHSPDCSHCAVSTWCAAAAHGDAARYPELPAKRKTEKLHLQVAVVQRGDLFLLERVSSGSFLRGLWMFPFHAAAAATELLSRLEDDLGGRLTTERELEPVAHTITFRRITAAPTLVRARVAPKKRRDQKWARLNDLGERIAVSSLALKIRDLIAY